MRTTGLATPSQHAHATTIARQSLSFCPPPLPSRYTLQLLSLFKHHVLALIRRMRVASNAAESMNRSFWLDVSKFFHMYSDSLRRLPLLVECWLCTYAVGEQLREIARVCARSKPLLVCCCLTVAMLHPAAAACILLPRCGLHIALTWPAQPRPFRGVRWSWCAVLARGFPRSDADHGAV